MMCRNVLRTIAALLLLGALSACEEEQMEQTPATRQVVVDELIYHQEHIDGQQADSLYERSDGFQVDTFRIADDTLHMTVQYSGGCKAHTFGVYWYPIPSFRCCVAGVLVTHDANGDLCEAWITDELEISLSTLFGDSSTTTSTDIVLYNAAN